MRIGPRLTFALPVVLALLPASMNAQSVVTGSVSGSVVSGDGRPVAGAPVVMTGAGQGLERVSVTDAFGRFAVDFLVPGTYDLRVENLGFVPLVVRGVEVPVGEVVTLSLTLEPASGVVARVDTVAGETRGGALWRPGASRLRPAVVAGVPSLVHDLAGIARLGPGVDDLAGIDGLPASQGAIHLDGIRFTPAVHPAVRGERTLTPVLPRNGTAEVQILSAPSDVEWSGGGAVLAATSRTGPASGGTFDLFGAWSGGPLWSSSELDFDAPDPTSVWASVALGADLVADTSTLFFAGEVERVQTPRSPRLSADEVEALDGLDAELAAVLGTASIEELARLSALARVDWWLSPRRRLALRTAVGRLERTFDGSGSPRLAYGSGPAGEATDFLVSADLTSSESDALTLEFRGGVSGSDRAWDGSGLAEAAVVGPGRILGSPAGSAAEASRLDIDVGATAHYRFVGAGIFKSGAQARQTRHSFAHGPFSGGRYGFGDLSAVVSGQGVGVGSTVSEVDFTTSEAGLFAQYQWEAGRDVVLALGARLDYATLSEEAAASPDLEDATGLDHADQPTSFLTPAAGVSASVDLTGGARRAVLLAAGSLRFGMIEPALAAELFLNDGSTDVSRISGSGARWPDPPGGAAAALRPAITLFGPDMRRPRHLRAQAGLLARLGDATSLHVGGAFRRSDFLPRRRDLNLSLVPFATDPGGRGIFGDLRKDGALVTAAGEGHRRFGDFDAVWALDPDGWSTRVAGTVGLEHRAGPVDVVLTYTRSRTEDNWVGAAAGSPDASLLPALPDSVGDWSEGVSDFDVPDRFVGIVTIRPDDRVGLSAAYRFASGLPFTPGYRRGVDVNGDGSGLNDPALVPLASELGTLASEWPCLRDMAGGYAERNGCREPARHALDARLEVTVGAFGSRRVHVVVDGLGLIESEQGVRDEALLLVDPDSGIETSADGSTLTLPVSVNPDFGSLLLPWNPGRVVRIGVRVGG